MRRSAEIPFSLSRTPTASTISLLISVLPLILDQVAAVDVGVRDGHHAAVGGQRDLVVARSHQLAGEALVAVAGLAHADAGAPAEVLAEVVGLRERALGAGRGHLQA